MDVAKVSPLTENVPPDRECSNLSQNPVGGGGLGRGLLAPEERDGVAYGVAAAEAKASHPARRSPQAGQSPQP
jgi:hypothetical protein